MNLIYCNHELIKRHIAEAVIMASLPMSTSTDYLKQQIDDLTAAILDTSVDLTPELVKRLDRAKGLGHAKTGSGHDCFLKGIVVTAVVSAPAYQWPQIQRYHFLDIISSQSKMHRITKMDIAAQCNEHVDDVVIDNLNEYIDLYNLTNDELQEAKELQALRIKNHGHDPLPKEDMAAMFENYDRELKRLFKKIISNAPQGLMLAAGIVTNYLQLKTIKQQRKGHKLEEWEIADKWIDELPYFTIFTGV